MRIDPLSDVVVIRRRPQDTVSAGGIALIESPDFREDIGTVAFCGKGRISPKGVFIPISVKPGDCVLFSTNGHQITKVNGEELVVLREPSIIGFVHDDDVHSYSAEQGGE